MLKRALPHTVLMVGALGVLPPLAAWAAGPDGPPAAAEILMVAVSDDHELKDILQAHHDAVESRKRVDERVATGPHHERQDSRESINEASEAQHDAQQAREDAEDARNDAREAQQDANEAEQEGGSDGKTSRTGTPEQKGGRSGS